eukprot:gene3616-3959_t
MSAPGENTTLKYLIFGLAFGTCLGNMFLAGKLKNLMKIKIPRTDYAKTAAEEAQRERARQESFKFNQESARRKNSKNQTVPSSAWTAWLSHCEPEMVQHLKNLQLWPLEQSYPSFIASLKQNFRRLAKENHPDLVPRDEALKRAERSRNFQEIASSYQAIREAIKRQERNSSSRG